MTERTQKTKAASRPTDSPWTKDLAKSSVNHSMTNLVKLLMTGGKKKKAARNI
jgi:hypothetical protein